MKRLLKAGFSLRITAQGGLRPVRAADDAASPALRRILEGFAKSSGEGLLRLALDGQSVDALSPDLAHWRVFAGCFFSELCARSWNLGGGEAKSAGDGGGEAASVGEVRFPESELEDWLSRCPPLEGGEYLSMALLRELWGECSHSLEDRLKDSGKGLGEFLATTPWNLVGRVFFHLAENKRDPEAPFAYMATYTHALLPNGRAEHVPLGRAFDEFSAARSKSKLLALLGPLQKASAKCALAKEWLESREIFHPLALTPAEAYAFLKEVPVFEENGILVRLPDWWRNGRPPRPVVSANVGARKSSVVGFDSMLDFSVDVSLEGETLSKKELEEILRRESGLALLRGRWVEVDREKLRQVLDHWRRVETAARGEGLSFIEGMRLLAGAPREGLGGEDDASNADMDSLREWSRISAGPWLAETLGRLRDPSAGSFERARPDPAFKGELRPYQQKGLSWLWQLTELGLGACLADDMGLGKTIQVIALLLLQRRREKSRTRPSSPSLLVVPASLIGNWSQELERFAPDLRYLVAHASFAEWESSFGTAESLPSRFLEGRELVIVTYGAVHRMPWVAKREWNLAILDEAQAIKNASSKQSQAVRRIRARSRVALTGTPIENHLFELWSIFDFICPGLLGPAADFSRYLKRLAKGESSGGTSSFSAYKPLRRLVSPYILRRLKTDKNLLPELPEKTELKSFCALTKKQAALYQQAVSELEVALKTAEGIRRRGVIFAYLLRFKQICNHPAQWIAGTHYRPEESGKFARLRELCEGIAEKRERILVFTQFREMTDPLDRFLESVFGASGLVLHGGTPVAKRKDLVKAFQSEDGPPYFVLSLKAGGTGLNLTAASHVVHFDRWWNPAVESQATDRAFRIGQNKNVLVHKFICRGTIEEKIDALIESKRGLAEAVVGGGEEVNLTELSDAEILRLVSLDMRSALEDA